jgi:ADP-ribose pyrophosphatase YjhB (NUDIX family)
MRRGMTLGARAILLDDAGRVVLVRHGYTDGWHLPGGGVERGEAAATSVVREIREECGVEPVGAPELFGIYTNFVVFPGDHVAVFVVRGFSGRVGGAVGFEIRDRGVFALDALPADTAGPARRRLEEFSGAAQKSLAW